MRTVSHYCQKCLAGNPLGQELCGRCGTRLMLVVEPPAARYEDGAMIATHEEHLLERVSALENRLLRMTEKLEQTLDLMLRQAKNSYHDHVLIDTIITVLAESGVLDAAKLNKLWRERCRQDTAEQETAARHKELRTKIISAYRGTNLATFERYVSEGFKLLGEKETARGIRTLERAAALASGNAQLHAFIGEHFFEANKNVLARDYLERALVADSKNEKVRLSLGLTCGDGGEVKRAKKLLKDSIQLAGRSFAAHYGLGRLLVAEKKWEEALKEFKSALSARPSPEANYVVGCAYFRLNRFRMAARHLRKAIEGESVYPEAFYVLGLVLSRSGEADAARAAFQVVSEAEADEPHYRSSARRILRTGNLPANPKIFGINESATKALITGGDKRLARVVREAALGAFGVESGSS
ncbi:MAG: tetratricopeptide repeat protein [Acidobacteria bacterium]|nr:tetratricopeptide repeat protein [Acidobacteriota bacterium]